MRGCAPCTTATEGRCRALKYRLEEIEITRPLPELALTPDESGVAVLVRRKGRPIDFILRAAKAGETVTPEALGQWIAATSATRIMEEAIREEITPPITAARPELTVAICTRHRVPELTRCLAALTEARREEEFEILVVDNAPDNDATKELCERRAEVRYTREPLAGLDFARNRAWREATGEWIWYVDDDAVIAPGWLDGFAQCLAENPDAAAVTGPVVPLALDTEARILFERRGGFRRGFESRRYADVLPGNACHPAGAGIFGTGANMAFRREVLAALGGFDEALDTGRPLPGGGDLDIFFRVIDSGRILAYEPRCLVYHEHRATLDGLRHQYYTWGLGLMAYTGKYLAARPDRRTLFRRLARWWFRDMLWQIKESLRGRHAIPAGMLAAEFCGGVAGLCGEYRRSQRRIAQIRAAQP